MSSESPVSRRSLLASIPAVAGIAAIPTALFAQMQGGESGDASKMKASPLMSYFAGSYDAAKGEYALPKLPYAYEALEPHIDAQTMTLHHTKHHQAYVDNGNKALKTMRELKGADVEPRMVEALQRDLSFNLGGHMMHTLFWAIMAPNAGGTPNGRSAELIDKAFGSFDNFNAYFGKVATSVKGSGWAVLAHDPHADHLFTFAMGDQDLRLPAGAVPVLAIDVWEHAYYLKYQNKRADYVNAWWNVVNWNAVNELLAKHDMSKQG